MLQWKPYEADGLPLDMVNGAGFIHGGCSAFLIAMQVSFILLKRLREI